MTMKAATKYLLDANVLMEAKRRYYRFGLCPGFWDCLVWNHEQGSMASIDRVKKEIEDGKDDLTQWIKKQCPSTFFMPTTDTKVASWFGAMVAWAQKQLQYLPEALAEFSTEPDGWLIAYAKEHSYTLVTHEVSAKESRRKVKIPDVCKAFDVLFVDSFDMLEQLNTSFTWMPGK
ncbi:MAG: DUF4411 family protein [Betaproteobacteria bacterium]|nr:DUF4411 family protein [Betaproteobacteria bacterium]